MIGTALVALTHPPLKRAVSLGFCGIAIAIIATISPAPGLEWFAPCFLIKLVAAHAVPQRTSMPGGWRLMACENMAPARPHSSMKNMAHADSPRPPSPTPLPLLRSIPYFLLPALAAALVFWWGIGAMNRAGVPLIWSVTFPLVGFFAALGCLAVLLAGKESPQRPASRLWLSPFRITDALLGLVVGIAGLLAYRELQGVTGWLLGLWPFGLPSWLPHFVGDGTFLQVPLAGNYWLIIVFLALFTANVVGEELWWRGYVLPRQVSGIGKNAWIANGLLWSLFHVFQAWDIVSLIPIALGIAFMSQYRQSVWIAIVAHGVLNCQSWIYLTAQML